MFNNEIYSKASKNLRKVLRLYFKVQAWCIYSFPEGVLFDSGTNSGVGPKPISINEKSFIDFDGIWIMLH